MHSQMPKRKIIMHVELDTYMATLSLTVCVCVFMLSRTYDLSCFQRTSPNCGYWKKKTEFV